MSKYYIYIACKKCAREFKSHKYGAAIELPLTINKLETTFNELIKILKEDNHRGHSLTFGVCLTAKG